MNAHELARALLAGPDHAVGMYEYNGGEDVFREIASVRVEPYLDGCNPGVVVSTMTPATGKGGA